MFLTQGLLLLRGVIGMIGLMNQTVVGRDIKREAGWTKKIQEKEKSKRTIYQDIIVRKEGDI